MRSSRPSGFTLVELLVVIGIIALLAAILLPVVQGIFKNADILKAKNEVQEIRKAVEAYYNTYGRLPIVPSSEDVTLSEADSRKVIRILTSVPGDNDAKTANPKEKIFLELKEINKDGIMLDPWETQYRMRLDKDLDGRIDFKSVLTASRSVVISFGPNRVEETNMKPTRPEDYDDITSLGQ
jgi:prepilin-type N-terminal cleavage/methylation domain-containing protein